MEKASPFKRRGGLLLEEEEFYSARKKMRPRDLSPESSRCLRLGSTPIPAPRGRLRHSRLSEVENEVLTDTLGISFTGNERLESPYFDKTKSKRFFHSCFEIVETLGGGSFGYVMKCRNKDDGNLYAVKILTEEFSTLSRREKMLREVRIFECIPNHENVLRFVRAWQECLHLYIQTELCAGNLLSFLKSLVQPNMMTDDPPYMQPDKVPEELCWNILVDILQGARHLHTNGVLHLDIKPENIFIGMEDGRCKLGDFGTAWNFREDERINAQEGDGRYAAPETYQQGLYTPQADTFSIGVTVLQFALGILVPRHARYQDTWTDLKLYPDEWDAKFHEQMNGKSTVLWETIQWLLTRDGSLRPTPEAVLENEDIKSRVEERRKQLLKSSFMFRLRSMASNVLQVLTLFLPRDLISRLRPLMNLKTPSSPKPKLKDSSTPATPCYSFEDRSLKSESSFQKSSSTPSRVNLSYPDSSCAEESINLPGRINLTLRFDEAEGSADEGSIDDSASHGDIASLNLSPIKKTTT